MYKYILIITMSLFVLYGINLSSDEITSEGDNVISSQAEAAAVALEYTGFNVSKEEYLEKSSNDIIIVNLIDTTVPFIHNEINNREAWKVPFHNVDTRYSELEKMVDSQSIKDFEVYIDATTGKLLKIKSSLKVYDPNVAPQPNYRIAEEQLRRISHQYLSLPDSVPNVSFFDCLKRSFGPAELSKETIGYYVIFKRKDEDSFPAWIIINKGFPPEESFGISKSDDPTPIHCKNIWRTVFNANNGKIITAHNGPKMPLDWKPKN